MEDKPMANVAMKSEVKDFSKPDETRSFNHGKAEIINIGGGAVGRLTLQPGWKWSMDVKPIAKTDLCEVAHFAYVISGRMAVKMSTGEEFELGPGSVHFIQPGHDAWVLGNEPVVVVDWNGATHYAKK
jgi:hypothetical protein